MSYLRCAFVVLLAIPSFAKTEDWRLEMQKLRSEVASLSSYLFSEAEFQKKSHREKILSSISYLETTSKKLDPKLDAYQKNADPSLPYILNHMKEDLSEGRKAFQEGKFSFARSTLKSAINRCFQCHTQNYDSKQWQVEGKLPVSPWLSTEEKINYLVAMRHFQAAKDLLEQAIDSYSDKKDAQFELERLVTSYLIVSLHTKSDFAKIRQRLEKLSEKQKMQDLMKRKVENYLSSLQSPLSLKNSNSLDDIEGYLSKAANKKDYVTDDAALVESVQVTRLLHQRLSERQMTDSERAKTYYLLAKAYQNINEPAFWDMHENYYEACIRTQKNSPLAKRCFQEFKDSLVFRNTGSSGTHLDLRDRMRLDALKKLSL